MPIFKVTTPTEIRLIRAAKKASAINHAIRPGVDASPVNPEELLVLLTQGLKVEDASGELALEPPLTDAA